MQIEQFRDKQGRLWIFAVSPPKITTNVNVAHSHIDVYLSINDIRNLIHVDSFRIPIIFEGIKRTWSRGTNIFEIGETTQSRYGSKILSFFKIMKNVEDADKRIPVVFSFRYGTPYSMVIFFDFAKLKFDRNPDNMYFLGARIKNLEPVFHTGQYYLFYEDHLLAGIDAQTLVTTIRYTPRTSLLIHDHYYLYNNDELKDNLSNIYSYLWYTTEGYRSHPVKPRYWNMSVDNQGAPVFYNGSGTIIKIHSKEKTLITKSVYDGIQYRTAFNRYQSLSSTARRDSSMFKFQDYLLGDFRSGKAMQSISQSFRNDVNWQSPELDNDKLIANNDLGGILS